MTLFASVLTVARHEVADAMRSRRALVLLVLYLVGGIAATLLFVKVLHEVETQVMKTVGLDPAKKAGGVATTLWASHSMREGLIHLSGDEALARQLLAIPPLALFFGWLAFTFTPLLVVLTSSARIAEEVWSGAVRFALFRTTRFAWCLGKFLGQALQLLGVLLLGAAGAWLIGWLRLDTLDAPAAAGWMVVFAIKAWVYALAYLGLALGVSQLCGGPNLAVGLGFLAMTVLAAAGGIAAWAAGDGWRRAWDLVRLLTPGGHRMDLWRADAAHAAPAAVFLLALSLVYFSLGHARFARKDL